MRIMRRLVFLTIFTTSLVSAAIGQTETSAKCPVISVVGPAGSVVPGDVATFTVNLENGSDNGWKYKWSVSAGSIIDGERKPSASVKTSPALNLTRIVATVEISGLPTGCRREYSGNAEVIQPGDPPLIAESTSFSWQIVKADLDKAADEFRSYPAHLIYVIIYVARGRNSKNALSELQKRIRGYLMSRYAIGDRRIVFVSGGMPSRSSVKVYRVPADAH